MVSVTKRDGKKTQLDVTKIRNVISFACNDLDVDPIELELDSKIQFRENITTEEIQEILIRTAAEKVSATTPQWTYVAARLLLYDLYKKVGHERNYKVKDKISKKYEPYNRQSFYDLIVKGTEKKLYGKYILENYTKEEIDELANYLEPERDLLFTYTGIKTLVDRYLVRNSDGKVIELPQEMYMLISMTLGIAEEKEKRLEYVKKFYDVLSKHEVTLATPVLLNARKPHKQLSSCFVLTFQDDLNDIFENLQKSGMISKFGGGIGLYLGKIRALGAPILNFKGAASGVLPVVKLINDVMVYVDQLGMRKGSGSPTLDIWHKDITDFIEIKSNVGDERRKAHDVHPAISIPDLFIKRVIEDKEWTLFDPYYVKNVKDGKNLEDFYGEEFERLYEELEQKVPVDGKKRISAFNLFKSIINILFETGEPYLFFRDTANRLNPNKHCGMVYSSNLCMEIIQNMSTSSKIEEKIEDNKVIIQYEAGDTVVCNLGAINLGKVYTRKDIKRVMPILVRMLDNVITLNYYPIKEAEITSKKYRAIGIGVSNYHYCLVKNDIQWESEEHLKFADKLFETLAYYGLLSSMNLAKERGKYSMFDGSDWSKGIYFGRDYKTIKEESINNNNNFPWISLTKRIKKYGLRNGYLFAVMPTGSTSLTVGATPSIDPIFKKFYKEEKISGILPQVPPEVDKYYWHYKSAYDIDQIWIVRAAAVRQKWIDQSQSLNLFIKPSEITGRDLMKLYIECWKNGLKTTYYLRSMSAVDLQEECESCSV
ncbi:MAG: ribonucleoside-diphosphate reductase subunit alpha [Nitrososphaerota archaeon]